MASTAFIQRLEIREVFLSKEAVLASENARVIPNGYRQATLEEVALSYRNSADFRKELLDKYFVRTSQRGLKTSGYHQISFMGKFHGVEKDDIARISNGGRSCHYPGDELVLVSDVGRGAWLAIYGTFGGDAVRANVAYVKIRPEEAGRDAIRR